MRKRTLMLGAVLFLLSLFLAFARYAHYYEVFLSGLFLMLSSVIDRKIIDTKKYVYLFLIFILAGLVADLLLGIQLTSLWGYRYDSLFEYVLLYVWVYPLGGIVMVQSYIVAMTLLGGDVYPKIKRRLTFTSAIAGVLVSACFAYLSLQSGFDGRLSYAEVLFYLSVCTGALFLVELFNLAFKIKHSFINTIKNYLFSVVAVLLATYVNFVLHEGSNHFAGQWVYAQGPGMVFGTVSVLVVLAWPLLCIMPLAAFYTVDKMNPLFKTFSGIFDRIATNRRGE